MIVDSVIREAKRRGDCVVKPPSGIPAVQQFHLLSDDVRRFYELAGGMTLFTESGYSIEIVPPQNFVLANPVIVGDAESDDISISWYIVARDANGEYLTKIGRASCR